MHSMLTYMWIAVVATTATAVSLAVLSFLIVISVVA